MWKNILYSGNNFNNNDKFIKYKFKLINTVLFIAFVSSFFIAFVFLFIGTYEVQILVITSEILYGCFNLGLLLFLRKNKSNLELVIYLSMFALYLFHCLSLASWLLIDRDFLFRYCYLCRKPNWC